jgi:hypothetical protein
MDTHILEPGNLSADATGQRQAGTPPNLPGAAIGSTGLIPTTNQRREGKNPCVDPGPFVIRRLG